MKPYEETITFWDNIFSEEKITKQQEKSTGYYDLDYGLDWLCNEADTILDFGCGNGSLLFKCACRGTKHHVGIDISNSGIELAKRNANFIYDAKFNFICGGISELEKLPCSSIDGVILSNIVDNVIPQDGYKMLGEIHRILKDNGKLFFKVNSYMIKDEIAKENMKQDGNLLIEDNGLYLWNLTSEKWREVLSKYFIIDEYRDIYFKEYNQYNRMFLLTNK